MNGIKVKFWGVRGSFPIPKSEDAFGGNTSCVEIRTSSNELVVLDMGTGLRNLGNSLIKSKNPITDINIILSHFHYDHILGFLMFIPLFDEKYTINIYAPGESDNEIESIFKSFLNPNFWPVDRAMLSANINFKHYSSGSFDISDNIKTIISPHGHPGGANSIRVEIDRFSVCYITDCEHPQAHLNQNVVDVCRNADILIHDAQYTPEQMPNHKGWGHSSWKNCVEVAKNAKVKQLVLFHHNPEHGNAILEAIEQDAQNEFHNTVAAKEGMEILIPEEVSESIIS
tara:strand:+ start:118 stop:972 length:855 start_codon:yes stop_codon:yes gene_type:complete